MFLFAVAVAAVGGSVLWNLRSMPAGEPQPPLRTVRIHIGESIITTEVAETDEARRRGLSYRSSLGRDEGMLFVFPTTAYQTIWMQGIKFPLDIVFINGDRVVDYEEHVSVPMNGRIPEVSSTEEADMVLELPAGRAEELGIGIGTRIQIR